MMHRRVSDRVQDRAVPQFDSDPYLTISDGRLVWMQDVYTTTRPYPVSTSLSGLNYIRNSVKVTIDAYITARRRFISSIRTIPSHRPSRRSFRTC